MKLEQALAKLEAQGDAKVRVRNAMNGASDDQFGMKLGDIRELAEPITTPPR
jgi:hypothetical protein